MNDSPGWASPGSSPSEEPDRGTSEQPTPGSRTRASGQQPPAGWSKDQPPAGQWSTPAGGSPDQGGHGRPGGPAHQGGRRGPQQGGWGANQGGWGAPPGWGGGWTPPPPAARPGVIPLRPLGVSEILDGAVSTMRAHWRTVLGISLVVAIITTAVSTFVTGTWFRDANAIALDAGDDPNLDEALSALGGVLGGSGVTALVSILGTVIATALLTVVVSRAVLGRPVTTGDAWREARGRLPRLLGLLLLLPVLVAAVIMVGVTPGLIVSVTLSGGAGVTLSVLGGLAGAAAGVWLWVRYSLAAPALMLEKQGVLASMRRSAKLVRGAWWRVLGIQLLTSVLVFVVAAIVEIPATIVAFLLGGESAADWLAGESATSGWTFLIVIGVSTVISSTITFPISAGVTALLYMDQRIRREALDLELARAAGLTDYGTPPYDPGQRPTDHAPGS